MQSTSKRSSRVLAILILSAILAACAAPTDIPSPVPTALPTQGAAAPSQAPTAAPLPTVTLDGAAPTSAPAAPAPATAQPQPANFTEAFDAPNDHWTDPVVVTTQAGGAAPQVQIFLEAGRMRFAIQDKETYVYRFFKAAVDGGVSVQATVENRGVIANGIALVCKADDAKTGWYEARLLSAENKYNLYVYDQKLKAQDKNPYSLLASGVLAIKEFAPYKVNTFTLTCTDRQVKLDLNNGLKVITQPVDTGPQGNLAGIGVMSYNLLPVKIDFKNVVIQSEASQ